MRAPTDGYGGISQFVVSYPGKDELVQLGH